MLLILNMPQAVSSHVSPFCLTLTIILGDRWAGFEGRRHELKTKHLSQIRELTPSPVPS